MLHATKDNLLVERLGVGGSGSDVSVTGSLVGTSGELEGGSSLEVGVARRGVRSGVVLLEVEVGKLGEHLSRLGGQGTNCAGSDLLF